MVCVGHVMLDVVAMLPGPLAAGSDTPAPVVLRPGGSAANTAAWIVRAGGRSRFVGRVGDDEFGRRARTDLRTAGVDAQVGVDRHEPTGVCIVLVGPDGERTMVPSAGANRTLTAADIPVLGPEDLLHVSGYLLLDTATRPAALAAFDTAADRPVSVDAASAEPLRAAGAARFLADLPPQVLLLANLDEAKILAGVADIREAARRLAARPGRTVIKIGAAGALLAVDGAVIDVTGRPATLLDSTGAGDAFAAGLLAATQRGLGLLEAAAEGNRLGALAVGQVGARG